MSNKIRLSQDHIETRIFTIREIQVMIDRDLAEMYQVETKVLNQSVKRNSERFPEQFRFQLSDSETDKLVTNCDRFNVLKHSSVNPYAFTEQGVAMLSAVLRSETAVKVSVQIMNAFVAMRKFVVSHNGLFQRIESIEKWRFDTEQKFETIFHALESKDVLPSQGVFFDGQVFDAYELTSKIIRSAKTTIVLVDNYINEATLVHLSKKNKGVNVILYTNITSKQLLLDVQKVNEQYGNFKIQSFDRSHDRFLIIDNEDVYHLGASLKDLGKRWFAFSKMNKNSVNGIITELGNFDINFA